MKSNVPYSYQISPPLNFRPPGRELGPEIKGGSKIKGSEFGTEKRGGAKIKGRIGI